MARRLSRREFLRRSGSGIAGLAAGRFLLAGSGATLASLAGARSAAAYEPFTAELPIPPVLTAADITLAAAETDVQILPGAATRMWTLGATFPGPTIRRPSGQPTRLTVQHRLPAEAGTLTIHHHGNHSASSEDGQPADHLIQPGGDRTYTYEFMEEGAPERAAFQWYHDHSHMRTGRNVWRGLAGMVILDDELDASLPLPRGELDEYDIPLMIAAREFDANNQLTDRFTAPGRDTAPPGGWLGQPGWPPGDEIPAPTMLVNGAPQPFFRVAARRYRLRILNASNFHLLNLHLTSDQDMVQIGTESGLLPAPISRNRILLGPAERAEIVVDFGGLLGQTIRLESTAVSGTSQPGLAIGQIMEFRVTASATEDSSVPAALRPLPSWVGQIDPDTPPDRIWAFGLGTDTRGTPAWTINGRPFDHTRVDASPALGSMEKWMFVNASPPGESHVIHIHNVDWKVVSRNNGAPQLEEVGLKETFLLNAGEVLVVASKFTDHLGPFMIHCHMLEHEDHGMMTTYEVVTAASSDRPGGDLDAVIDRTIPDPAVRDRVRGVVGAARGGSPAPAAFLAPSARLPDGYRCDRRVKRSR